MGASTEARRAGQPNRMTVDTFVERSRKVHGNLYDYSQVDFVNTKTKVRIICPVHGAFMQTPCKHMAGGGCPHPECVTARRKATMKSKYGVEHALQAKQFLDKQKSTNLARHGAENPMQVAEFREKYDASCMAKYGAASPFGSREVRDRIQATSLAKYGSIGPMADPETKAKSRETCRTRYGVDNPMQSGEVVERLKASMLDRYGTDNPMRVGRFQEKQRAAQAETFLTRYGTDVALRVPSVREKAAATNLVRYGSRNAMQSRAVADRMTASKIANGTTSTSSTEEMLYGQLCDVFGASDVVRQHKSSVYDWACDFYIKSRDMYIELNADFSHGGHWFDADDPEDCAVLAKAHMRIVENPGSRYAAVPKAWCNYDVRKRSDAKAAELNYVVFWDDSLRDAALWFAMGCPDGRDWAVEYSWLPDREIRNVMARPQLTGTWRNLSQIARYYQFDVFYRREIEQWHENRRFRETTLQVYLYHNRLKYIEKTPTELSDLELARGFRIAGILKGYTGFNVTLMDKVLDKYTGIRSVYDPCAGWGERMLCCHNRGISYHGVDVNAALEPGYKAMMADFGMLGCDIVFADSGNLVPPADASAVITCPPYGDTEIYSDSGAEKLGFDDFIAWWGRIVAACAGSSVKYFCFQVNQKYRAPMSKAVADGGFALLDEFEYDKNPVSHFNRTLGGPVKHEFETMLVFGR